MNTDFNPYQPPVLDEECETIKPPKVEPAVYPYRYSAKQQCLLVHINNHYLPDRCVCCNAEADEYTARTLHWQSSFMYVLLMVNLLIFLVMYFITRKKIPLSMGLCHHHATQRHFKIFMCVLSVGASIAIPIGDLFLFLQLWWLILLMFFGGLIGLLNLGPLRVSLVEPEWVHIKGCGMDFIHSLEPIDDDAYPHETPEPAQ